MGPRCLTLGTHSFSYVKDLMEQELGRRPWKVNTDLRKERSLMLRFTMEATQLCMAGNGTWRRQVARPPDGCM